MVKRKLIHPGKVKGFMQLLLLDRLNCGQSSSPVHRSVDQSNSCRPPPEVYVAIFQLNFLNGWQAGHGTNDFQKLFHSAFPGNYDRGLYTAHIEAVYMDF